MDAPAEGADARQAVLHVLRAGRLPRARTTCRRSGRTSTRASSTRAGTSCARRSSRARRSSASSPPDAELTARPAEIPAWDETPEDMRPIFAREMEVYAGFLEHTDHHLGRLIDALKDLEVLDDTLIYYIIGDNGASAEGTPNGCFNEMAALNGLGDARDARVPDVEDRRLRRAGGLQPLRGGLGARDGHALPVDQAGRLALGRHAQRHDRALAERHQGQGRGPQPVPSRDRRRPDDPRSGRPAASERSSTACSRRRSKASACSTRSTTRRRRSGTRPSTSRCSATAASITRAGRR